MGGVYIPVNLRTSICPFPSYAGAVDPANGELVHSFGILLASHRDLLSPAISLAWLGLTLLAAWCVGRFQFPGRSLLTTEPNAGRRLRAALRSKTRWKPVNISVP